MRSSSVRFLVWLTAFTALAASSCSDDDPPVVETVANGVQAAAEPETMAELREICDVPEGGTLHVVTIDTFLYSPPIVNAQVGDTVAWVNLEDSCDDPGFDTVTDLTSCDTHHWVVTEALTPAGADGLRLGPICSPARGKAGALTSEDAARSCADEGGSNVRCHTFTQPGVQAYTCVTNPFHTVLMHGAIIVQ